MKAYASLYASDASTSLSRKCIWEMEDYLRNDDAYARRQQTLLRYGGQQLRVSRGRWQKLKREQRVCQLCNEPGAVEDERHMVLHCPFYHEERECLRKRLGRYSVHAHWASLDLSSEALFGLVLGVRPMMNSLEKHRKVAMSYCRQFLTTALRRRERLLATLPKTKKARPEVANRSSSDEVKEQANAAAVAEVAAVDVADRNDLPNHDHDPIRVDIDADAYDDTDIDVDSDCVSESDDVDEEKAGHGQPISIVVQ